VLATGYNGPVSGLPHELIKFERPHKYDWFIHAEDNAVAFARCDLREAAAYVTGTPCAPCFRRLLQVGIRRIVQGERHSACLNDHEFDACRAMARALDVEWITIPSPGAPPISMIDSDWEALIETESMTTPSVETTA
jgi:deoxycytidylate deaminase